MIRRSTGVYVKRGAAIAASALLFFLAACGGGSSVTDPNPTPTPIPPAPAPDPYAIAAGSYGLMSVNGSLGLPASITYATPAPGGRLDITSGSMVLRADKTFTETFRFTVVPASGATSPDSDITTGTFTLSGTAIVFTTPDPPNPNHTWSGTLDSNGNIVYNDQGFQAAYKK